MATASLLKLNLEQVLDKAQRLSRTKLPKKVIEVTLEPKGDLLCIRFRKPAKLELGEPVHPLVHVYRDKQNRKITAVEILDVDDLNLEV